jgi:hypothetical protein
MAWQPAIPGQKALDIPSPLDYLFFLFSREIG